MKFLTLLTCLFVCSAATATDFSVYPECDLTQEDYERAAAFKVEEHGTAAQFAGEAMKLGGAAGVSICRSSSKLVVQVIRTSDSGTLHPTHIIFSE